MQRFDMPFAVWMFFTTYHMRVKGLLLLAVFRLTTARLQVLVGVNLLHDAVEVAWSLDS